MSAAEYPDFAKIVRASDGRQLLVFMEPDGDSTQLHQVMQFDVGQVDVKMEFGSKSPKSNRNQARIAFDAIGTEEADALIKRMADFTGLMEAG